MDIIDLLKTHSSESKKVREQKSKFICVAEKDMGLSMDKRSKTSVD